jgi:hypothetical protein
VLPLWSDGRNHHGLNQTWENQTFLLSECIIDFPRIFTGLCFGRNSKTRNSILTQTIAAVTPDFTKSDARSIRKDKKREAGFVSVKVCIPSKHHEVRKMTKIMVYGFSLQELTSLNRWVKEAGIQQVHSINPTWTESTLRQILAGQASTGPVTHITDRLILFHDTEDTVLDMLIQTYSLLGLPTPLWAMTTETNQDWTLETLLRALLAERNEILSQQEE